MTGQAGGSEVTYGEPVVPGFEHVFRGKLLHRERSPYQTIEVFEHEHFGRMLLLDGVVQTTERDEFCYHEMLVHPPLLSRPRLQRVLVIGGGDGGTLRRVLEHGPQEAWMCEIDEAVTAASQRLLPSVSAGAFDDPRTRLVFEDGAAFVARHEAAFDAIVVDSTDPVGPALVLFSEGFYRDCARALRPEGVLVAQTGSPLHQGAELQDALQHMRAAFATVEVYTGLVPTYPGVYWSFAAATNGTPVSAADPAELRQRLVQRGIRAAFYTPELHASAFVLPAFVRELVAAAGGGGSANGAPAAAPSVPRS